MLGSFKRFIQAWALVLGWQLPRRRHDQSFSANAISREYGTLREKRQVCRRRERKKFRVPRRSLPRGGYSSSRPKGWRFSNQQSLRRMFRNS